MVVNSRILSILRKLSYQTLSFNEKAKDIFENRASALNFAQLSLKFILLRIKSTFLPSSALPQIGWMGIIAEMAVILPQFSLIYPNFANLDPKLSLNEFTSKSVPGTIMTFYP